MTAIETDGLRKEYGTGEEGVLAVGDLDLTIEQGEVFGFLGPNGAGKSTTINMLLDYVRPTSGSATVLGLDAQEQTEAIRERIGVLPEGFGLYDRLTGRRHVEFAIDWKDADDEPRSVLDRVGLDPDDTERPVGDYSKGMQQRLAMAMALVGDPDVLILDEPSSGLDPHGIRTMRRIVQAEAAAGTTVFFSSHILSQVAAVCDRVGILSSGELVAIDSVQRLRQTVGSGSELHLRLATDRGVDVTSIDGVESVRRTEQSIHVTCSDPRAKAMVVTKLTNAGVEILDLSADEPSLEDVFEAYTNGDPEARRKTDTEDAIDEEAPAWEVTA